MLQLLLVQLLQYLEPGKQQSQQLHLMPQVENELIEQLYKVAKIQEHFAEIK